MKSYFQNQFNFLKGAIGGTFDPNHPPPNAVGWRKLHVENYLDDVWDSGMHFGKKLLGWPLAIAGAAVVGNLVNDNPELGAAAIMPLSVAGGLAGGAAAGFGLAKRFGITGIDKAELILGKIKAGGALGFIGGAALAGYGFASSSGADFKGKVTNAGIYAGMAGAGLLIPAAIGAAAKNSFGSIGGLNGIGLGAAHAGAGLVGGIANTARALEFGARTILTGGRGGIQGPLDAWLPNFRNLKPYQSASNIGKYRAAMAAGKSQAEAQVASRVLTHDVRRYALNPSVVRRATGIMALAGIGSFASEAISPKAPPPTAFFDGRHMRHINDMGANANYGQAVLGRNSSLNVDYGQLLRTAAVMM